MKKNIPFPEGEITTSYFLHNSKFSADQLIGFNSSEGIVTLWNE
jgi:hypothetical protein